MASKRKQDEKHLNILRGMAKLDHNKHCFDCHQRGPTYLNMTIGAFVCTGCSGLLRGLNPPHRVKSISMASFTPEEIEFVKSRGNEFCRKVWLGLYDNRKIDFVDKDENKIKDFMTQKYEKKRYYVAPTETMMEQARKENTPPKTEPQNKPLRSMGNIPSLSTPPQNTQTVPATSRPTAIQSVSQSVAQNVPPSIQQPQQQQQPSASQNSIQPKKGFDLLGELGGDPFASTNTGSTPSGGGGGFADFGAFPGAPSAAQPTQMSHSLSQPTGFTPNTGPSVLSPQQSAAPSNNNQPNNNMVVQSNSFGAFSSSSGPTSSAAVAMSQSDRYSALAALDTALSSSPATSQTVNWDGSVFGGGSSSALGISSNNNSAFGGGSAVASSGFNSESETVSSASSNPFNPFCPPNPFGVSTSAVNTNQGMVANPFSSAGTGFGQSGASFSQPGTGFNQLSTAPASHNTSSVGTFGGGNQIGSAAAGALPGQFRGVANGNMNPQQQQQQMWGMNVQGQQQQMNAFGGGMNAFGGSGGMMGGQVAKAPGFAVSQPQQQQFGGGWGGAPQPAANPFMNVASQQPNKPLNSTNPFL